MIWKCFRVDPTHADGWKVIICQILGHLLHQSSLTQKHYSIATRSSNRKLANLIGLSKERPKTDLWPAETQLFGLPWLRWFHLSIINQQVGRQTLIHARLTPFIHRQTKQHSPLSKKWERRSSTWTPRTCTPPSTSATPRRSACCGPSSPFAMPSSASWHSWHQVG